jgi:hypothetical protein
VTAIVLVPWMVLLGRTLPSATRVQHWSTAWIGLDALLTAGCAGTALLDRRSDRRAGLAATATATVAVLDAWFDLTTAQPGAQFIEALLCGVGEFALAGYCVYLALTLDRAADDAPLPR